MQGCTMVPKQEQAEGMSPSCTCTACEARQEYCELCCLFSVDQLLRRRNLCLTHQLQADMLYAACKLKVQTSFCVRQVQQACTDC